MQSLARYWANEYDWRKVEARLNSLPNFITEIDGLDIHFIHARSKHENALPLIITHGWPGTFWEYRKVIGPLSDPGAHGGDPADAFDVSKDDLLTTVMIYWVTRSYGTSARYYYEAAHDPWTPAHERWPVVEAPTGISVMPAEFANAPRRWIQRYYNLKQIRHHTGGGHYAAWEEPEAITTDLRDFFRSLS